MLMIRPIQDKERQRIRCTECGIPYREDALAYEALVDDAFVGISQFTVNNDYGLIWDLVSPPGIKDYEALFIMGRQTMNWIDLLGIHCCKCREGAGPARVLLAMGFTCRDENQVLTADMSHMFDGSCGGNCNVAALLSTEDTAE